MPTSLDKDFLKAMAAASPVSRRLPTNKRIKGERT
jgi:hypothetical protein